jgi:hypothetical protein
LFAALLSLAEQSFAQQTIFNVPSGDVLDKGKAYAELDMSLRPFEPTFSSFVPRFVVGVGHRIELGVNLTGNIQPGADSTTLAPSFKWRVYDGKENGWSLVLGDNLQIPLRNRTYQLGNYAYAQFYKSFKPGTRIGFGAYDFTAGVVAPGANRAGGQFTFEHPATKKVTLAADWFTGGQALGYLSVGAISKPHPRVTLYTAYSLGNRGIRSGNHFFLIELGYNFN